MSCTFDQPIEMIYHSFERESNVWVSLRSDGMWSFRFNSETLSLYSVSRQTSVSSHVSVASCDMQRALILKSQECLGIFRQAFSRCLVSGIAANIEYRLKIEIGVIILET